MTYGLVSKFRSTRGTREELIAIMTQAAFRMPGCLSYVIARDAIEPDALWITEIWEDRSAHAASLAMPEVRAMIMRARPLIDGLAQRVETEPVSIA